MSEYSFSDDEINVMVLALREHQNLFSEVIVNSIKVNIAKGRGTYKFCSCKKYKEDPEDGLSCARCKKKLF